MASFKRFFQFGAFFILVLAVMLYSPIHDDLHDRTFVRIAYGLDKILMLVGDFVEWRGGNRWPTERITFEKITALLKEPLEEGIQERKDVFNNVNVHIFEPKGASTVPRPGIIYIHGGGFTLCSSEEYRNIADVLAKRLQAAVISVNYRLTPEFHHPAQINDVFTLVNYVYENAEKLGIDPKNFGVIGDSAGGNLAAAVTIKLRDISSPVKLRYQALIYPWVQGLTVDLPSHQQNEWHVMHFIKRKTIAQYIAMYIGADIGLYKYIQDGNHTFSEIWKEFGHLVDPRLLPRDKIPANFNFKQFEANRLDAKDHGISKEAMERLVDPYAFPLMAKSLKNLPPAFVMTTELDSLRDEGILYAQRLEKDGVLVERYHDRHGFHGHIAFCKGFFAFQASKNAVDAIVNFIDKLNTIQ